VDVSACRQSAFEILTPPTQGSETYGIGWRLKEDDNNSDDNGMSSKDKIIHLAREVGDPNHWCSTCFGGGLEQGGFRATIKARVAALGSGKTPPIVSVMKAYSSNVVNPFTLETNLVDDHPCQYYFGMDDFTKNGTSPSSASSPTSRVATPAPTMSINYVLTTDGPSNFPSGSPTTLPSSDSPYYSIPFMTPSSAPTVTNDHVKKQPDPVPTVESVVVVEEESAATSAYLPTPTTLVMIITTMAVLS
jgi:hypothetical protein